MVEITILGSSAGDPSPDRACASLMIEVPGKSYQFDAGDGVSSSILKNNIDHSKIGAIFISHMHADHITGLFLELQMMRLVRREEPIAIFVPEEAEEAIKEFMLATYLFPEKMGFDVMIESIRPDPVFGDENMTLYARANSHLEGYRDVIGKIGYANRMRSYSFVIEVERKKIIYSGDVGSFDDYADLLVDCDLLITEGFHIDYEETFSEAAKLGLNDIILTHMPADEYRQPDRIKALAAKYGIEGLHIAHDGLRIAI
jgi:ribonuclease BN (tRNA processing enzyme)